MRGRALLLVGLFIAIIIVYGAREYSIKNSFKYEIEYDGQTNIPLSMGLSSWPKNSEEIISIKSSIYHNYEYDFEKEEEMQTKKVNINPWNVVKNHKGVCEEYAIVYANWLERNGYTPTYYVLVPKTGPPHEFVAIGTTAFENNRVFENLWIALERYHEKNGDYKIITFEMQDGKIANLGTTYYNIQSVRPFTSYFSTSAYGGVWEYYITGRPGTIIMTELYHAGNSFTRTVVYSYYGRSIMIEYSGKTSVVLKNLFDELPVDID